VDFEKWQALGNDYLVIEGETIEPELVTWLCDRHHGVGGDGVLLLGPAGERGFVARLRIFNPDGSEAELSGNGAREAMLYLRRRGWTDSDVFSVQTVAGEVRARVTGQWTCTLDVGRASLGPAGDIDVAGVAHAFQHIVVGNPQTPIRVEDPDSLDLQAVGAPVEHDPRFPNRTNVSFWHELAPDRVRARIWERGVGETKSSGTGACGVAVAHVLRGGDSPVTVVLDGGELVVGVEEDLHVELTGWARPVFRGTVDPEART
jgi:diaminopimelate epimerase